MFTGIVAELGTVEQLQRSGDGTRLSIRGGLLADAALGDSVAVNGVCLTVADRNGDVMTADVLPETLRRSALGDMAVGDLVNLELAVTPLTRLGGHLVQGHVDGVGTVVRRRPGTAWDDVTVEVGALAAYAVEKGSITFDGVSLTVVDVEGGEVSVSLIPETLRRTTLGRRPVGSCVNVESDVIAKYVERLLATSALRTRSTDQPHEEQPT